MKCNIFYSWQSDRPNSTNRGLIQDALEGAAKDLKQDEELIVEPVIDRDTAGVAGSPDIGTTIFSKIDEAAAFVCDVSIINQKVSEKRLMPNPNVLIELGYALKTLGQNRIVMVMNTAFGGPEELPFDLKQKRVQTYHFEEGGTDKAEQRKGLQSKLKNAIKDILVEHQKTNTSAESNAQSPTDRAIIAVQTKAADQSKAVREFMKWFVIELKKLDPHDLPGIEDENLVEAIEKSAGLVHQFSRLAEAIAEANAEESGKVLFKQFEHILAFYDVSLDFNGRHKTTDFDLFKFVGYEICVTLVAKLMREARWELAHKILSQQIYLNRYGKETLVNFASLSQHILLLDGIRADRLKTNTRRISIQADLLKSRHETNGPLSEDVSWDDFIAADFLLFFNSRKNWYPRTLVYSSKTPRFLLEALSTEGAKNLATALGITSHTDLKNHLADSSQFLAHKLDQIGGFSFDLLGGFESDKIAAVK